MAGYTERKTPSSGIWSPNPGFSLRTWSFKGFLRDLFSSSLGLVSLNRIRVHKFRVDPSWFGLELVGMVHRQGGVVE